MLGALLSLVGGQTLNSHPVTERESGHLIPNMNRGDRVRASVVTRDLHL